MKVAKHDQLIECLGLQMNVHTMMREGERRTSADDVFEQLRSDIVTLRLAPGTNSLRLKLRNKATFPVNQ